MTVALMAAAAALGAVGRYGVDRLVVRRVATSFPLGTLLVNLSGSLALGVLVGLQLEGSVTDTTRLVLGTGFVGAYTTFSTFAFEAVRLHEEGAPREALGYVVLSLAAGAATAGAGLVLGLAIGG